MKSYYLLFFLFCLTVVAYAQNTKRDIDSVEKLIKSLTNEDNILSEKAELIKKYYNSGAQKKAKKLYDEALKEALTRNSLKGLGALYNIRGYLFYHESAFDSALAYFEKSLEMRKRAHDDIGILKSTGNLGSIYFMLGDNKKALGYYEEALKKEAELKYEEGKYLSINNLGYIYERLKMLDRALMYFRKAEKIYSQNESELIYTYDGLSEVYKEMHKMDSALVYSFKSKEISESLNEQSSVSYALFNIAVLYMLDKKPEKAREYLRQSLNIASALNDKRLMLGIYGNYAAIEVEKKRPDSALVYIEKIIPLQKELNITMNQEDLAKLFAEYYYSKKDYQKAYDYIKMYDHYTDSLYNLETTAQINEMQAKYESTKKEKENLVLQHENKTYRHTRNYLLIILVIALIGIVGAILAYRKIKHSNKLLSVQKHLVEEKQKEILDSINYARRIQFALLASDNLLRTNLPEHFVLFKPKDVVSGDFYWASPTPEGFIYITADCTGHGVPGAFMSLLNISKLSQIVNEHKVYRPDIILNHLRQEIIRVLNPEDKVEESKDGMDAVVCKLDLKNMKLEYAAANNSFYVVRNRELLICKADKMPVGKGQDDLTPFTYNELALQSGDLIYTFTDGYADQFGGSKGKKFKYKQLEDFLLSIVSEPMDLQKKRLDHAFESWKGELEQVDDVCIIGVRV